VSAVRIIRAAQLADVDTWCALRSVLWPEQ